MVQNRTVNESRPARDLKELGMRDQIKALAAEMFAERGFHSTSLRKLAAAAGVTLGTLYHYFPSKEDLLAELIDDAMAPLMDVLSDLERDTGDDPVAVLTLMVEHFILGTRDRLGTARISDTELRSLSGAQLQHAVEKRDAYQAAMEGVIDRGVALGVFHVDDVKLAVYAILGMCNGVFSWYRQEGRLDAQEIARYFVGLTLRLVGATGVDARDLGRVVHSPS